LYKSEVYLEALENIHEAKHQFQRVTMTITDHLNRTYSRKIVFSHVVIDYHV